MKILCGLLNEKFTHNDVLHASMPQIDTVRLVELIAKWWLKLIWSSTFYVSYNSPFHFLEKAKGIVFVVLTKPQPGIMDMY